MCVCVVFACVFERVCVLGHERCTLQCAHVERKSERVCDNKCVCVCVCACVCVCVHPHINAVRGI